jgi:hypothetical protein
VQAIFALNPPNNIKELRHFLGMVQYYRDMWARRSEMLAPLTDLVGECGETKTTKINKTKKKNWRWNSIHQQAFDNVKAAIAKERDKHLQRMETVLTRLRDAGLKVNAAKSLFCAHEIEYLGYILTREGIKPQPKEVQAILALNLPNSFKELRHFLGMVQYYQDMWARHSEMLAPLTDLVGDCGETKTNRKNKTKKKPWWWDPIHHQVFDNIKASIAKETVLAYPEFSKLFEIYMDAS